MMFSRRFGKNVEVYFDDMLIKIVQVGNPTTDLEETFKTKAVSDEVKHNKYAFEVQSEKLLGFMVF